MQETDLIVEIDINEVIRNNILALVNETNTSYRKLSESIGASSCYIQKVVEGHHNPTYEKLEAIAEYFKVPINYLFTKEHSLISEITDYLVNLDDKSLELTLTLVKHLHENRPQKGKERTTSQ